MTRAYVYMYENIRVPPPPFHLLKQRINSLFENSTEYILSFKIIKNKANLRLIKVAFEKEWLPSFQNESESLSKENSIIQP